MIRWIKRKIPAKREIDADARYKVLDKLADVVSRAHLRGAIWLNNKTNHLSRKLLIIGLWSFILSSSCFCLWIIYDTWRLDTGNRLTISSISNTIFHPNEEKGLVGLMIVTDSEYQRMMSYLGYLDSLSGLGYQIAYYDSIAYNYPSALDSAILIDKNSKPRIKK